MKSKHIEIIALANKHNFDWQKTYQALVNKEDLTTQDYDNADKLIALCEKSCINIATILDSDYPMALKEQAYKPPFVIFYKGDITTLSNNSIKNNVAICASRRLNDKQQNDLEQLTKDMLALKKTIVLSYNSKSETTQIITNEIIEQKAPFIAFLTYPSDFNDKLLNEYCDLMISEYPIDDLLTTYSMAFKYRIMAVSADNFMLGYCTKNSGNSILTNYALEKGKNIYAIPYSFDDKSLNNYLIDMGGYAYVSQLSFVHNND